MKIDTAIWTVLITALLGAIGWLFRAEKEKRAAIENQLSEKKYKVYQSVIGLFIEIINSVRKNQPLDQEYLFEKMTGITKELIIYGSDPVLKRFSYYKQHASPQEPIRALKLYYDVMIAIRKDMGHPKTVANEDDLLGMFLADYNVYRDEIMLMK